MNFLSPLGMKAEADNSNVNFSQLCDDVSSTIKQLFCHCHCTAHALYLLYFEEMDDHSFLQIHVISFSLVIMV